MEREGETEGGRGRERGCIDVLVAVGNESSYLHTHWYESAETMPEMEARWCRAAITITNPLKDLRHTTCGQLNDTSVSC